MVENSKKLSRKAQLDSYDGCARLRPIWDAISGKYDAVLTPSVPDEAPIGIASTGDAVSLLLNGSCYADYFTVILLYVDYSASSCSEYSWFHW